MRERASSVSPLWISQMSAFSFFWLLFFRSFLISVSLHVQFMHSKSLHEQGGACDDQIGCKDIIERQR